MRERNTIASSGQGGGIGFLGALFLVFLVLKLTDVITWSWWWVTAPLWMPWLVALAVVIVGGTIFFLRDKRG